MMNKYNLRVLAGHRDYVVTVYAVHLRTNTNYYYFVDENGKWIASYPISKTIIESIEEIEEDE
jgi:hypothetical protein